MKQILVALKEVFITRNPARCMLEAMMKWDFRAGDQRRNLMQLCFANLASWPLLVLAAVLMMDPFKHQFQLSGLLGEDSRAMHFLLDGHNQNLLVFFILFFILEWLFRMEFFLVAIVLYFMNRGELHVNLAVASVFGVYLSRNCYLWWLTVDCVSEARTIWSRVNLLQFLAWALAFAATLFALDYVQINHLFDGVMNARLLFLLASIGLFHLVGHLLLLVWGHFYYRKKYDPSFLRTSYSTAHWILRFPMSQRLQNIIRARVEEQLPKHQQSHQQYVELKGQSPGLSKLSLEPVLRQEIEYLKEALLRLNRI